MNEDLPEPMTPPDCNLRGLPFMPLQVVQLLDSDLFIKSTGDEFKAAVALWCKSWNQIPGGSLPDDDVVLQDLSRSKVWKKVRAMAMKGWVKCSDGRLYHPVVAANAIQAWEGREEHRETVDNKTERQRRWRARVKEISERLRGVGVTPPMNPTLTELERLARLHGVDDGVDGEASTGDKKETAYKGQGKGKGQGSNSSGAATAPPAAKRKRAAKPSETPASGPVWEAYRQAYQARYSVEPVRNAKVNSQLKQVVERLGDEAADVTAFFLRCENVLYVRAMHPTDLLVRDAEKLHTQWATGRRADPMAPAQQSPRASRAAEFAPGIAANKATPFDGNTIEGEVRHVAASLG